MAELNIWSVLVRILLAALFGGCIGGERGRHGRAAGLRTHILVCLGATMTTMIGMYSACVLGYNGDPLRVGAQVVSGIGFLGAGTIMVRSRAQVTGLTTAAGLWATACIGLALGVGFYAAAFVGFAVVMITITLLMRIERVARSKEDGAYYVELMDVHQMKEVYEEILPQITELDVVPARSGIANHVGMEFVVADPHQRQPLLEQLQQREDVVIALPVRQ
ncbi:MAG: MgtC/SapB family protein [Oscillospiraceae bacterium]|nr:MgtC/SapB family protein [Oscillospiraceae bacterium]